MILYKYTSLSGLVSILGSGRFRFNHPENVNDPFECLPGQGGPSYRIHRGYLNMRWWYLYPIGFTSFSAVSPYSDDSILLWSHYGGAHTGAALAIDTAEFMSAVFKAPDKAEILAKNRLVPGVFYPMRYCENRFKFHNNNLDHPENRRARKDTIRLLCRKAKQWSYEKEYRLFSFAIAASNYHAIDRSLYKSAGKKLTTLAGFSLYDKLFQDVEFPAQSIKGVYLGCKSGRSMLPARIGVLIEKKYRCTIDCVHIDKKRYGFGSIWPGWFSDGGF